MIIPYATTFPHTTNLTPPTPKTNTNKQPPHLHTSPKTLYHHHGTPPLSPSAPIPTQSAFAQERARIYAQDWDVDDINSNTEGEFTPYEPSREDLDAWFVHFRTLYPEYCGGSSKGNSREVKEGGVGAHSGVILNAYNTDTEQPKRQPQLQPQPYSQHSSNLPTPPLTSLFAPKPPTPSLSPSPSPSPTPSPNPSVSSSLNLQRTHPSIFPSTAPLSCKGSASESNMPGTFHNHEEGKGEWEVHSECLAALEEGMGVGVSVGMGMGIQMVKGREKERGKGEGVTGLLRKLRR